MSEEPLLNPTIETAQIVAVRGSEDAADSYLVVPSDADPDDLVGVTGRILDAHTGELSPPLQALEPIRHGYWRPFEGSHEEAAAALERTDSDQGEN